MFVGFPPGLQKEEEGLAALKCLSSYLVPKKKKDKKGEDKYTIPYFLREVPVRMVPSSMLIAITKLFDTFEVEYSF